MAVIDIQAERFSACRSFKGTLNGMIFLVGLDISGKCGKRFEDPFIVIISNQQAMIGWLAADARCLAYLEGNPILGVCIQWEIEFSTLELICRR